MSDELTKASLSFADLGLPSFILEALTQLGYQQPSPIQTQSIPDLLKGRDLVGIAQTGTGKTAAFSLPILTQLDNTLKAPQALILVPTRELAIQVAEAIKQFASHLPGFKCLAIYGGQGMSDQLFALRKGVQVVVGTPGRVMDHLRRKTLKLDAIKTFVLDEADEMLRMGFIDDVTWILEQAPKQKQVALFSATMPQAIRKIAGDYLENPKEVRIQSQASDKVNIEQSFWLVRSCSKRDALLRFLAIETFDAMMLFVRTKAQTVEIADLLERQGYRAAAIHGDLTQKMREHTILQLKRKAIDIMVATDVAARGIDVARITHVLNFDAPFDAESYVHRIGRTGRAGRSGAALIFLEPRERRLLSQLERVTKNNLSERSLPTDQEVKAKQLAAFKDRIGSALEDSQQSNRLDEVIAHFIEEQGVCPKRLATALATLVQGSQTDLPPITASKTHEHKDLKKRQNWPDSNRQPGEKRRRSKEDFNTGPMERYRIAVGRRHRIAVGDIVGAIANEADLGSESIGRIQLHEDFSTVDLPVGMPSAMFQHLKKVRVRNHPLNIERLL